MLSRLRIFRRIAAREERDPIVLGGARRAELRDHQKELHNFQMRLVVCAALVAAVGVPMGIPFPAGIARVAERAANFVPWAWGINGLLSVIASLM